MYVHTIHENMYVFMYVCTYVCTVWFNLTTHSHAPHSFSRFLCVSHELLTCHFICNQNGMSLHKNNTSKFSKRESRHNHKQQPQDVA